MLVVAVAVAGAAVGLAPLNVLSAVSPGGGAREYLGMPYGAGPRRMLDVYVPAGASVSRPVIVFFYGGAWQEGERAQYRFVGRSLAAAGFVVAVPDYRVYPEVSHPSFLEDCAEAVRWTRAHAPDYGGDPARLFLMGHSAGAYNAAMLALDARWLGGVGLDPARHLAGWIGLSGPYDFLPIRDPVVQTIFGPRERWPVTQPILYATARAPRTLLLTGAADERVRPGNSERLAARLRSLGVPVVVSSYAGLGHADTLVALSPLLRFRAPVMDAVSEFVGHR